MKKRKVILIAECLEKGIGKHVTDLYKNLKKNDNVEVFIIYGNRAEESFKRQIEENDRMEITSLERKIGLNDIKAIIELKKKIKEIKPNVVHCHSSKAGLAGRIAAKMCKVEKIIYSPHAYFFLKFKEKSLKRKIFILAERFLSKFCTDITVTTSKGEDEAFRKNKIDKENKKILIEHGLEVPIISEQERNEERNRLNIDDNIIFIGAMARFEEQKDPVGTFEIMKRISEKRDNIKCIFWGNGSFYDTIKELNEENNNIILLPGEATNPNLNLKCLDIYLTASLYEGLPYTLLESLALGLPIVASNVEGNKDCVFENKNGKLFQAKNYDEAVKVIEELLEENKLEEFGENSFKIFEDRFLMKKMIDKYNKLYEGF